MPLPKVAYSYARARFLFNNEKDGALHLQIEARNETQGEEYSGDLTFTHPFYNIYAVVTESGVGEISRYEMAKKYLGTGRSILLRRSSNSSPARMRSITGGCVP